MGFKEEKQWLLEMLKAGAVVHEFRGLDSEKNWLSDNRLSLEEAVTMVSAARGDQAECRQHHVVPGCNVWIFKVRMNGKDWYIKFHRTGQGRAKILSFHPSEETVSE